MLHGEEEPHDHGREKEIDERRTDEEEDRRSDQKRQESGAFVLVETGGDKLVELRGNHRKGDDHGAEHRDLDLREEEFLRRGIDQRRFRDIEPRPEHGPFIGNDQQVEEMFGNGETGDEGDEKCAERPDQPRAQLHEMLDQRLRLILDVPAHASSFLGFAAFVLADLAGLASATAFSAAAFLTAAFLATAFTVGFDTAVSSNASADLLRTVRFGLAATVSASTVATDFARARFGLSSAAATAVTGAETADAEPTAGGASGSFISGSGTLTSGATGSLVAGAGVDDRESGAAVAFWRSDLISFPSWRSGFIASRSELVGLRLRTSEIVCRTSSISASFKASSNWVRKSPAILRRPAIVLPKARIMGGKSFGPTTTISTTAITRSSLQPISNINMLPRP
ncbi:hypothetical protein AGR5A_Cc190037 [Agrobacterium genomosp. 5 str. CFBP 6626]|nr:hypothetical protein AGR5A_Cc190037 [Agrobacterium genomosp. 5 str. CFBP 6626]